MVPSAQWLVIFLISNSPRAPSKRPFFKVNFILLSTPLGTNPPLVTNSVNVLELLKEKKETLIFMVTFAGSFLWWKLSAPRQAPFSDYMHSIPSRLPQVLIPFKRGLFEITFFFFPQEDKSRAWQTMTGFICWLSHWLKDFHYSLLLCWIHFVLSNRLSIKLKSLQWKLLV